jgi:hypothetical protein
MLDHYKDIIDRINEPPKWWDRCGCPRYCDPTPENCSHVYAKHCAFMVIECQACSHEFVVEFAASSIDMLDRHAEPPAFREWDPTNLHYGDPPNIGCCPAGATMNSVPRVLLGSWDRTLSDWEQTHKNVPVRPFWEGDNDE